MPASPMLSYAAESRAAASIDLVSEPFEARSRRRRREATSPRLVLDIGEPCWISGPTAAALWGFDGFRLSPPFHVTLLRDRKVSRANATVHTTDSMDLVDRSRVNGLPVMAASRTIVDLARWESMERLTAALDSALRDGLTSEEFLHGRIAALRGSGRYGIPRLLDVIDGAEATRGGHSWLERRFLALASGAGLGAIATQQVLTRTRTSVVRVDCRFEGVALVVELLGYRWHRSKEQLARDAARQRAAARWLRCPAVHLRPDRARTPAPSTGTAAGSPAG